MFKNFGRSAHPWQFNGREFVPGAEETGIVVLVRDGYLPVMRSCETTTPAVSLPEGHGAVAGYCYIQTAGGKLANRSGVIPAVGFPMEIAGPSGHAWKSVTDERGFFTLPLPTGSYDVRGTGNPVRVTVTAGKTVLIAIRTGKRMID